MSWLSDLVNGVFGADKRKKFVALLLAAVRVFLGKVTGEIYQIVLTEVVAAEHTNETGWAKWKMAYEAIRKKITDKNIPEWLISILIESAVSEIDPK